jgi:hypothetical protein
VKSFRFVSSSLGAAVIFLPAWTVADSSVHSGLAATHLVATAHVTIRIVIPQSLSLSVGSDERGAAGARTVSVMRKVIAQDAVCRAGEAQGGGNGRAVCTASSP